MSYYIELSGVHTVVHEAILPHILTYFLYVYDLLSLVHIQKTREKPNIYQICEKIGEIRKNQIFFFYWKWSKMH